VDVDDNSGVDFNVSFFRSGRAMIGMKDTEPGPSGAAQPPARWYHAIDDGLVCGWPIDKLLGDRPLRPGLEAPDAY
jgi:hypothetical protein